MLNELAVSTTEESLVQGVAELHWREKGKKRCTALNMMIMDRGLPKDIVEDKVTDHKLVDVNFTLTNMVVVTAAAGIHQVNKADVIDKEQVEGDSAAISIKVDVVGTIVKEQASKVYQ